jgi:hypothetical protein
MGDFGIFIPETAENLSRIQKSSISLLFASDTGSGVFDSLKEKTS